MTADDLKALLQKYLAHQLTEEEFRQMWGTLGDPAFEKTWQAFVADTWNHPAYRHLADEAAKKAGMRNLLPQIRKRRPPIAMGWLAAAACVAGLLAAGFWLSKRHPAAAPAGETAQVAQPVIQPGGNKAVLTLADGSVIELDSAANGSLGRQGNTQVVKLANGQIAYRGSGDAPAEVMYNTMRTPRGGQYRVTLPDGTGAWLNAASSLTYPTAFTGAERLVKVTGEVYFEVAKTPAKTPFRVEVLANDGTPRGEVTVTGTHFNINAYDNEATVKTTLLEGAVKVRKPGQAYVALQPGQQAVIGETLDVVRPEDIDDVTAWKDGYFIFNQTDIQAMMRQAERWYDINVIYHGGMPDDRFSGTLPRSVSLQEFLEILNYSDVDASIKGRTVLIAP